MQLRKRKKAPVPEQPKPMDESMHALADSAENLIEVQSRADEVKQVAEVTRDVIKRNHFANRIQEMITNNARKSMP